MDDLAGPGPLRVTLVAPRRVVPDRLGEGRPSKHRHTAPGESVTPPRSSARALHNILFEVNKRTGSRSAYHAWQDVVRAEVGSSAFAQAHAEAAALLSEVVEDLWTLEMGPQKRYLQYLPAWWEALVRPRSDWAQMKTHIIKQVDLDMLGGLADLLETRASIDGPRNPQASEALTNAVTHILRMIQDGTDIPLPVRDQIVADLKHVLWLLARVETYGMDHAVAAVERVAGRVTAAATRTRSQRLKKASVALTAALAISATITTDLETIVENIQSVFGLPPEADPGNVEDIVESTVIEMSQVCVTKALTPGGSTTEGADAVDAELVED